MGIDTVDNEGWMGFEANITIHNKYCAK
jgi:hypothetical protein